MKVKVTVQPNNLTFFAETEWNHTLMRVLQDVGITVDAPCGGNGKCGKCQAVVNGKMTLLCASVLEGDTEIILPGAAENVILTEGDSVSVPVDPLQSGYLAAFDIGTTTVVCYLMDPQGKTIGVESALNPQTAFGADVISRIRYALAGNLTELSGLIRKTMGELLQNACARAGIPAALVKTISVVGNPCMQQLFLEISPGNLAAIPFSPVITETVVCPAAPYFPECPDAVLTTIPDISGYVGADTVACILASQLDKLPQTTLMVDIGTNGEMVLQHQGKMIACATAAGPALEGANIQCGMRGSPGAIDHVWTEGGQLRFHVIGNGEATGICGSGLIDAAAVFLELGWINERGRILLTEKENGQRAIHLSKRVFLTQDDIRQIMMAKGAIAAGIQLMSQQVGIQPEDIRCVLLAGAFGTYMNSQNACRIGLLPPELHDRIRSAGNLAGEGAKLIAHNKNLAVLARELCGQTEFLELASCPQFSRVFSRKMFFPESALVKK